MSKLTNSEINKILKETLPKWKFNEKKIIIQREFKTKNWQITMMVSNTIGFIAESSWHHPELVLNYNKVTVKLNTHDEDGVTMKDIELAKLIENTILWLPDESNSLSGNPNELIKRD